MSQQLRQLKSRIRSVEGTWKVTRAMEMVSMSKYKSVEAPLRMARAYFTRLQSITMNLIRSNEDGSSHPFLTRAEKKEVKKPLGLFVISSETGLCGSYNTFLFKAVDQFLAANAGREIKLFIFGRKAASYYRKRGRNIVKIFPVFHGRLKADFYQTAYNGLTDAFFKGDVSEVYVAYARFVNAMKNEPKVEKLLSVDVPPSEGETAIVESGSRGIMSDILPMYVSNRLRLMFLESLTSEYSSRMVAMKGAKENAKDLIGDLTLLRNKIRQAAITKEVIEIISSSEALKG